MAKNNKLDENIDALMREHNSSNAQQAVDAANQIVINAVDESSPEEILVGDSNMINESEKSQRKKPQTISWPQKPRGLVAGGRAELKATASSGLPVAYQVVEGAASLQDNVLIVEGSGKITVRAEQSGNDEYESVFLDKVINVKVKPIANANSSDKDDDRIQVSFFIPKSVHQKYRVVAPRYCKTMRELMEAIVVNWIDDFESKHGKIELLEID